MAFVDDTQGHLQPGLMTPESSLPSSGVRQRQTSQTRPDLSPGAVIKQYEIIRKLGSGGMGLVFLARDVRLGRLVAIKFLLAETGVALERFIIEARATAACRHENIVVIYDVGDVAGFPYMVLEYISGQTLRNRIRQAVPHRPAMAIELMLPVARALARAHEMGIIHRDLKPENILISDTGQVKVVDFGVAKQLAEPDRPGTAISSLIPPRHKLTHDDAVVGTTDYMSPEQWLGEPTDARTDIWAFGMVLFELSTGVHPQDIILAEGLGDVSMVEVPMPSARNELPKHLELAAIIDQCLMKGVEERLGSAQELVEALERLQRKEKSLEAMVEEERPFAGLSAFQESDAGRFLGRRDDIAAVVARLRHEPFVIVAGPSGAGKSSFVLAGLIPTLKRAHREGEVFVLRPGRRALASLVDLLLSLGTKEDAEGVDRAMLLGILREQPGYFGAQLRNRCKNLGPEHRILLFIDQFEEVYTQETTESERAAFGACLAGVADDASSPLRVIVTIRSDFLDNVAKERRHQAAITRGLAFLPPMTVEGLRQALEKPLESVGYRFEDHELVAEIVDGLVPMKTPLPLLQFIATLLWDARDRERRVLTREAYTALGGMGGALSTHADAILAAMTSKERRIARRIFTRLVTPEKTRAILHWDEALAIGKDSSCVERLLWHLADARLLHIDAGPQNGGRTVELTHEAFIEGWTTLRQWLHDDETNAKFLADVRTAAMQWENNGREDDFLWRNRAAVRAKDWLAQHRDDQDENALLVEPLHLDYLRAIVRLANRTKSQRKRWTGVGIAFLCGVVFIVSFLALQAQSEAKRADAKALEAARNADEAQQSALAARNATRMAAANAHRSDATLVLALLREMEPTTTLPIEWKELAQWTLRQEVARAVLMHDEPVQWAEFSPDGRYIVTAAWDRIVRVWNADGSGEPILLAGHSERVESAAFSRDGQRIVTASQDKTVRIWNIHGSAKPIVLQGHGGPVNAAVFSPDGKRVVSGSSDKTIRIWNSDGSGNRIVLAGHDEAVTSVAFHPDGRQIVSGSDDGTVRVWNSDGHDEPVVLRGHRDHVHSAAFSPDGQRVLTASFDNTARVWNADGSGTSLVLEGHVNSLCNAAFSPDGKHIVTGSWDYSVRLWNSDGEGEPVVFEGHQDKLSSVSFSPDGKYMVSASLDKSVRVWDVDRRDKPQRLEGHERTILSAAFSADGGRVVTASFDATARVWELHGTKAPLVLRGHEGKLVSALFSPDGRRLVTAAQDKTARVWDANGGETLRVLRGHDDSVWSAAFSPDGRRIVTASWDKTLRVWNADEEGDPLVLRGHEQSINTAAFSPDGLRIVSGSEDNTARIWNADGSGVPRILRGHRGGVYSAAFSPDGRYVITASWDKTVMLWNLDNNDSPRVFEQRAAVGTGSMGGTGAFGPDGQQFVTIADDKTLHIWNTHDASEPLVVYFPELYPTIAAFSPDGSHIVTASHEQKDPISGTTRVWATVWPTFAALTGLDDPRLWRATRFCLPVSMSRVLLGVSEKLAHERFAACRAQVIAASKGEVQQQSQH